MHLEAESLSLHFIRGDIINSVLDIWLLSLLKGNSWIKDAKWSSCERFGHTKVVIVQIVAVHFEPSVKVSAEHC